LHYYGRLRSDAGNAQIARSLFSQLGIVCVYMEVFCRDLGKNERETNVAIQFFPSTTASVESLSRPEIGFGNSNVNLMLDKISSVSSKYLEHRKNLRKELLKKKSHTGP